MRFRHFIAAADEMIRKCYVVLYENPPRYSRNKHAPHESI